MAKKALRLNTILAVASCKCVRSVLRHTGKGGGTALPGKVAMKFQKDVLETVSDGVDCIVVTGTNGKTTTANILESALTESGRDVLANKSGANLLSGITAEFCCAADWLGRPKKKVAVIECDEGALKQVAPRIHPRVIVVTNLFRDQLDVVTNLFRDQLDRYGEVMNTLAQIRSGVEKAPQATLVLNAEDSLVSSLALDVPNCIFWPEYAGGGSEAKRNIGRTALHPLRNGVSVSLLYLCASRRFCLPEVRVSPGKAGFCRAVD